VGTFVQVPPDQGLLANAKSPGQSIDQRLFVHMLECAGSTQLRTNRAAEIAQAGLITVPGQLDGENTLAAYAEPLSDLQREHFQRLPGGLQRRSIITTIQSGSGQHQVCLRRKIAYDPGVIVSVMVHKGIGQPLILRDVVLDILDELVAVAGDNDLSVGKSLTLEQRLANALAMLMIDCIDCIVEDQRGGLDAGCLREENRQSQASNMTFTEHLERIDASPWGTTEAQFNAAITSYRQMQFGELVLIRIPHVELVIEL